ncbi:MAG TPA: DUF6188 family protein [Solirubrobacterales bacterium]|jgi:hypothetical protein
MPLVIPDTFPVEILNRFRGPIVDARPAYPEVLHLYLRDADDGEWCFVTQEADWTPSDPEVFQGKTVVSADVDDRSGQLTIGFSDASALTVIPDHLGAHDDIEAWELFTPEQTILTYGPRGRWQLGRADNLA